MIPSKNISCWSKFFAHEEKMFMAPKFILPLGPFLPRRSKPTFPLLAGRNTTRKINAFAFFWTSLLLLSKRFPLLEAIKIRESQTKTFLPPPTLCARYLMSASWGHNRETEAEHDQDLLLHYCCSLPSLGMNESFHLICIWLVSQGSWSNNGATEMVKQF